MQLPIRAHRLRTVLVLAILGLAALLAPACRVSGERPQPDGLRTLEYQGAKVVWENRGGGTEALVFVHGWCGDHGVWSKQMESLQPWRRIAIDLPGHGASDKPRREYGVDFLAESILAVMQQAGVERAVLVGHSNGAVTVRRFLELHPERVAGLVLVDGPLKSFFASPEEGRAFVAPLHGDGWKEWAARTVDGMLAPMKSPADRARVRATMLATPRQVMLSSFEGTLDPALWREQPIGVPLLLVLARSPFWDADYEAFVRRLAPQVQYEVLDGVSHFLMLDAPGRFDELVRGFLVHAAPFARR